MFVMFFLKDECSFVSLRDVERAMQVMVWFYNHKDTLGRLMGNAINEQRREEDHDPDEDDSDVDEEVSLPHLRFVLCFAEGSYKCIDLHTSKNLLLCRR